LILEPNGRSEGTDIPGRNPDTFMLQSSNLKITQAYELTSSNPSGATAWIVNVTTVPLPLYDICLKELEKHLSQ